MIIFAITNLIFTDLIILMKKPIITLFLALAALTVCAAKNLHQLQQEFVDLRFGLFIHFGMGTYLNNDWADPDR